MASLRARPPASPARDPIAGAKIPSTGGPYREAATRAERTSRVTHCRNGEWFSWCGVDHTGVFVATNRTLSMRHAGATALTPIAPLERHAALARFTSSESHIVFAAPMNDGTQLWRVAKAGGVATPLGRSSGQPVAVSVCDGRVYWVTEQHELEGDKVIRATHSWIHDVPLDGGAARTLASRPHRIAQLHVDGAGTSWIEWRSGSQLAACVLVNGAVETTAVVPGERLDASGWNLAAAFDAGRVYRSDRAAQGITVTPRNGGAPQMIRTGAEPVLAIASSDAHVLAIVGDRRRARRRVLNARIDGSGIDVLGSFDVTPIARRMFPTGSLAVGATVVIAYDQGQLVEFAR